VTPAFLLLFAAYAANAVLANRGDGGVAPRAFRVTSAAFHVPLFILACVYASREGAFSRQLVSPLYIAAGLLAGHLIFGVSLLITHQSLRAAVEQFFDMHALWAYAVENPRVLMRFLAVSVSEELVYRVAAQPLLIEATGNAAAGIVLVAAVFSVVHKHFFRNPVAQSLEFIGFALLLGVLYYGTGSLVLVLVIHAVRNAEIAFLEYLLEQQEAQEEASPPTGPGEAAPETP